MKRPDLGGNSIIWLASFEQNHPHKMISDLFEKHRLSEYRSFVRKLLRWYVETCDTEAWLADKASCIWLYEDLMHLLEASYIQNTQTAIATEESGSVKPGQNDAPSIMVIPDDLEKTDPIHRIIYMIVNSMDTEKIFLLGSYPLCPHGEVEYDLLVLVRDGGNRPLGEYESLISNKSHDMAPVTASVYKLSKINGMIAAGNYFFSTACKPANLVYDAERAEMAVPPINYQPAKPVNSKKIFLQWMEKASNFLAGAVHYHGLKEFSLAAFMLHQAVEHGLNALLIPLMQFRTQTHNLHKLTRMARRFDMELFNVFPRDTEIEIAIFSKLQKAYIHGRYKDNFSIAEEDAELLMDRVMLLLQRVNEVSVTLLSGSRMENQE